MKKQLQLPQKPKTVPLTGDLKVMQEIDAFDCRPLTVLLRESRRSAQYFMANNNGGCKTRGKFMLHNRPNDQRTNVWRRCAWEVP